MIAAESVRVAVSQFFSDYSACHESCNGNMDQHSALVETREGECYGEATLTSNNCKVCDHFNWYPDDNLNCQGGNYLLFHLVVSLWMLDSESLCGHPLLADLFSISFFL